MHTAPHISVVIPVFNEEENLPVLFDEINVALSGYQPGFEVLFIDDGSTDTSPGVILELAESHPQVRYILFGENNGQSAAFMAGFRSAAGEVIVTMDADLQNDPADIPLLLAEFAKGVDMVVGWRARRKDTWAKRMASKIGNAVRNRFSNVRIHDTGCSLKLMRADMIRRVPMFTGMHRFLPLLMKLEGARISEVKVNHRPRIHGRSKYGILDRAMTTWFDLIAAYWMTKRHIRYTIKKSNLDSRV